MSLTLKQLCDSAREELGWDVPSLYAASTDPDGKQTFSLANRQGSSMMREPIAWSELKTEATITLVAAQQGYNLAADYSRMVPGSEWDQDAQKRLIGPRTARMWAKDEHGGVVFGLNWRYEIRAGQVVFQQTVESGDAGTAISYEYVSSYWAKDTGGSPKLRFTSDNDTQRFDDDVFIQGLIWRLKNAKGFPSQVEFAEYQAQLNRLKARDGGMPDVDFGESLTLDPNIPETGFGG